MIKNIFPSHDDRLSEMIVKSSCFPRDWIIGTLWYVASNPYNSENDSKSGLVSTVSDFPGVFLELQSPKLMRTLIE